MNDETAEDEEGFPRGFEEHRRRQRARIALSMSDVCCRAIGLARDDERRTLQVVRASPAKIIAMGLRSCIASLGTLAE